MKLYHIYIAECSDKTLYTGYCANLEERLKKHNDGKGAKYTRHRRPIAFVYSESFKSKSAAMKREAEIKKLPRSKKLALVTQGV